MWLNQPVGQAGNVGLRTIDVACTIARQLGSLIDAPRHE